MLYSIVAVLVLVLDQAVKYYTVRNIPPQAIGDACKTLIPGVIHMTNTRNYGAAFSIMENARVVLLVVSALFIVGIIILISMDIIHTRFGRWTAVLVMAGALGNCIDRLLLGYVVDMFEFELFNFAVFNVADVFITLGGLLFCIHVIVYREPEEERNAVPRPEKKPSRLFASRQKPAEDDVYEAEEDEENVPAPRKSPKALLGGRKKAKAAKPVQEETESALPEEDAPRRSRRSRRNTEVRRDLEDDLTPQDPDDPFAEWESGGAAAAPAPQPEQPAAPEAPAPRKARRAPEETPPARSAKRRAAPALEDDEDEPVMPAPKKAPKAKKAAPPPEPVQPAVQPADSAGFDEYSLEDILAEFRDS